MIKAVIDQAGPQVKDVVFSTGSVGKLSVTALLVVKLEMTFVLLMVVHERNLLLISK